MHFCFGSRKFESIFSQGCFVVLHSDDFSCRKYVNVIRWTFYQPQFWKKYTRKTEIWFRVLASVWERGRFDRASLIQALADTGGPLGPGPPLPPRFLQNHAVFREFRWKIPYFEQILGSGPPWPKSWICPWREADSLWRLGWPLENTWAEKHLQLYTIGTCVIKIKLLNIVQCQWRPIDTDPEFAMRSNSTGNCHGRDCLCFRLCQEFAAMVPGSNFLTIWDWAGQCLQISEGSRLDAKWHSQSCELSEMRSQIHSQSFKKGAPGWTQFYSGARSHPTENWQTLDTSMSSSQGYGKPVGSGLCSWISWRWERADNGFYRVLLKLYGMGTASGSQGYSVLLA